MPRKFTISLIVVLGILVLVTGVAWRLLENETFLKNKAGKLISDLTGRELVINGPLKLQLGALTTLQASDVSLSNAPWATGEDMLKVGYLLVTLNPWSLFSDRVEIREIRLEGVNVKLVVNEVGESNWDIFPESDVEVEREQLPVKVEHIQIVGFSLTHETPTREDPLEVQLENVFFDWRQAGKFDLALSGNIDGQPLQLDGSAGPVSSLAAGGPFNYELKLSLGDIVLDMSGSMVDISTGTGVFLDVNFTGPEFGWVTEYLDLPEFSSGSFDFNLLINAESDKTGIELHGDLGTLDILANGEVDELMEPTEALLQIHVTGPDLRAMGETFGVPELPIVPYQIKLDAELVTGHGTIKSLVFELGSDRVEISGGLGALPRFHGSDLEFVASGSDLSRWGTTLGVENIAPRPFALNGTLSSDHTGVLATTTVLQSGDNHLRIEGLLGTPPAFIGADFEISFLSPDPGSIAVWSSLERIPAVPANVKGRIGRSEQGWTLRNVLLEIEGNKAEIDGLITLADDFHGSHVRSDIEIPNVAALGRIFNMSDLPEQPLHLSGSVQPAGSGIEFRIEGGNFGGINLSLQGNMPEAGSIEGIEAEVSVEMPSLRTASFLVGEIDLPDFPVRAEGTVHSKGNLIRLSDVVIGAGQTVIRLDAELTGIEGLAGSTINFNAQGPDLSRIVPLAKLQSLPRGFTASGQWIIGKKVDAINDFELSLGSTKLNIDGSVDDLLNPAQLKLEILAGGPDISLLNEFLGQSLQAEAFSVSTEFDGSSESFRLENLHAQLGQSDLSGNLQVTLGDSPGISGALDSDFLDLSQWSDESRDPVDDRRSSEPGSASDRLIPDLPLLSPDVLDPDLNLDIGIATLNMGNFQLKDILIGLVSNETMFQLDPLHLKGVMSSSIKGMLQIDGTGAVPDLVAKLEGQDFRLGLATTKDQPMDTYPPMDISLDIRGSGTTFREVASSLNGRVRLYQGPGRIANAKFDFVFSDLLSELFSTLNPFAESSPYTNVECSVIVADIISGKVTVEPVIFQTEKITILTQGVIDLSTEEVDFTFNTRLRTGIGISTSIILNPFLKVVGNLSSPAIQLDPEGTAIKGGVAVATGGLSLLFKSVSDRYFSDEDPCGTAIEETSKRDAGIE